MSANKKKYLLIAGLLLVTLIYVSSETLFPTSYYQKIPVRFSHVNAPIIDVEIEGTLYPIGVFPASKFPMSLYQDIMTNIKKIPHEKVQWKTGAGGSFEAMSYLIPKVKIGNLLWRDVITIEEKEGSMKGVMLGTDPDRTIASYKFVGDLGRPFFDKYNVLFDFPHERMIITNDIKKMKKEGFDINKMVKIPLEEGRGMIMKVETDLGSKNFLISTGSTLSGIRTSLLQGKACKPMQQGLDAFISPQFIINGHDFGEMVLCSYELPADLHEIDGEIGMDFLKNHVVYLDYHNRVIYIEK